jgi:hypothetical protein
VYWSSAQNGTGTVHLHDDGVVNRKQYDFCGMHATWTEFVSANDEAQAPERYGHSLTTFTYDDILVVCFGGTSGAGVTSQVRGF